MALFKKTQKYQIELFKILQEAFFMHPAGTESYVLEQGPDGTCSISYNLTSDYDFSKVKPAARAKFKGVLPEAKGGSFGVIKLNIKIKDKICVVDSKNIVFNMDQRYSVFSKEDLKVLEVLSKRCLDFDHIKKMIADNNGILLSELSFVFIPEDVLALRVFINSKGVRLGDIDVSELDDLTYAFSILAKDKVLENKRTDFDGIEKWNTSKVKKMLGVFAGCVNFNKDLSSWDTSKVEVMDVMFASCKKFNQDLSGFNTSSLTSIKGMFYRAEAFNQNLSSWDTSKIVDMSYAFFKCKSFNQDISKWNMSSVKNDENMFLECPIDVNNRPESPSADFKRNYYERYVGPNSKKIQRNERFKKITLVGAAIIIAIVFGILSKQGVI